VPRMILGQRETPVAHFRFIRLMRTSCYPQITNLYEDA